MDSKLQTYITRNLVAVLKGLLFLVLFSSYGCAVAYHKTGMMSHTTYLHEEKKFEELTSYVVSSEGPLSTGNKARILRYATESIKNDKTTGIEFINYVFDSRYYIISLIELAKFDQAIEATDKAFTEMTTLINLAKKTNYQYQDDLYRYAVMFVRLKGYAIWFKTGDRKKTISVLEKTTEELFRVAEIKRPTKSSGNTLFDKAWDSTVGVAFDTASNALLDSLVDIKSSFLVGSLYEDGVFYEKVIGDYRQALQLYEKAQKTKDKLGLLQIESKYFEALRLYKRIMNVNLRIGNLEMAHKAIMDYEDYTDNLIFKTGHLMVRNMEGIRDYLATMEAGTGALFAVMRDFKNSEKYFQKSYNIVKEIPEGTMNLKEHQVLGTYYVLYGAYFLGLQGKYTEGLEQIEIGLRFMHPYYYEALTSNEVDIETAFLWAAELHMLSGNYDKALEQAETSMGHARRTHNNIVEASAAALKGDLNYKKGEKDKAKKEYETALVLIKGTASTENWKLFYGLGRVYEDLGKQREALEFYNKAVQEVEKLWNGRFKDTQKQVSFIDNRLVVFEPLIRLLAKQGKAEEALKYMESSKSRTFFEASVFYSAKGSSQEQVVDSEKSKKMQTEIATLSEDIEDLSQQIKKIDETLAEASQGKTDKKAGRASKSLNADEKKRLNRERASHEKEKKEKEKRLVSLRQEENKLGESSDSTSRDSTSGAVLTAAQVKKLTTNNLAILEYYVGEQTVVGLAVTPKRMIVKELPISMKWLKEHVVAYRNAIEKLEFGYKEEGVALYNALVKPFEKDLDGFETIAVVPHGILHYLPFQALIVKDDSDKDLNPQLKQKEYQLLAKLVTSKQGLSRGVQGVRVSSAKPKDKSEIQDVRAELETVRDQIRNERERNGKKENRPVFLIDKHRIVYAPSATILDYSRKQSRQSRERLLALGSPPAISVKDLDMGIDVLEKLPFTKIEVQEIGALFADKAIFIDEAATLSAVKNNAANYDVLLFSTHGLLNRKDPMKSAVFFNRESGNDGRLTLGEIEQLKLKADIVALSACETGLVTGYEGISEDIYDAKFPYGDDLVGLQRGFMKAGSASVLSSLWSVADESTSALMIDFFKRYKGGKDKAAALQEAAQMLMQTRNGWEHPYYWAPFVLSGAWQ